MAASNKFTDDDLNYFRVCYIVTRIVPEGLRTIFKREWDAVYKGTPYGQWEDTPINYTSFYSMESTKTRKNKNVLLGIMSNGDTKEWDCTCLFYAIMYSDCVGKKLHSIVKTSVNELREIRNEVFAHTADGSLSKVDLQASVQKIITAFTTLKLDTTRLEELKGQNSFPTEELNKITQQFDREKERNAEPVSFCVLPPPPSHDTIGRLDEVGRIYEKMKGLSDDNKGQTTVVYLSGNPGCGKSELSRQVGERYFVSDDNTDLAFTMTINASNMDTLLQSYVEFAGRLKCDPDSVSRIGTSQGISLETKVHQLQALTGHQVAKYSSWLMIIDNVTDLKSFSKYWPQSGETTSGGNGQILVSTQDSHSIVDSSHCEHISLSRGMTDEDAVEVLSKISHFPGETDEILLKVAEALDFQPLALACAGVYMQRIRTANSLFTWQQCLQKVEKGKREATENVYEKTSFNYPTSMTAAVYLALEREMKEEKIMKHAFEFLSSIAQESIPLEYVVQYAMNFMPDEDEDSVAATICSSSLLISSGEVKKEISLHQVVYHCLQANNERVNEVDMFAVISAFSKQLRCFDSSCVGKLISTRPLVNHFVTVIKKLSFYIEQTQSARETYLNSHIDDTLYDVHRIEYVCCLYGKYKTARKCCQVRLAIKLSVYGENINQKGSCMLRVKNNLKDVKVAMKKTPEQGFNKYFEDVYKTAVHQEDTDVGCILISLGIAFAKLNQIDKAKICFEKAIAIFKCLCDENYPPKGIALMNLGNTFRALHQLEEAKTCYEQALRIYKVTHDGNPNYPNPNPNYCDILSVADVCINLARTLMDLRQHEEAKICYKRALAIYETVYDKHHPLVFLTLGRLAKTLGRLGQDNEVKECYEKVLLVISELENEKNNPRVGTTKNVHFSEFGASNSIFYIHDNENQYPWIGDTLLTLGDTLAELGQHHEAKTCFEKALSIYETAYDESHPLVGSTLNNIGFVLHKLRQFNEAKTCHKICLAIYETNDTPVGVVLYNLGTTYSLLGKHQKAKTCYERALATLKIDDDDENRRLVGGILNNLGNSLKQLEKLDEAKTCYKRALSIFERICDENVLPLVERLRIVLKQMEHHNTANIWYETTV